MFEDVVPNIYISIPFYLYHQSSIYFYKVCKGEENPFPLSCHVQEMRPVN